ncbi:MAG: hypothetical protein JO102_05895 [Elusimicrobia bacterium]|nr:hypothetical protein [Elusimicrobiota bacterium]
MDLQKGKLFPDIEVEAQDGQRHRLWDFRQKTHLLLVCGSAGEALASLERNKKALDWLSVRVIATPTVPPGLAARAYGIDRYGELLESYELDGSLAERVEKDFTYYESCHC